MYQQGIDFQENNYVLQIYCKFRVILEERAHNDKASLCLANCRSAVILKDTFQDIKSSLNELVELPSEEIDKSYDPNWHSNSKHYS